MMSGKMKIGTRVRMTGTEERGVVASFPGQPLTVVMDDINPDTIGLQKASALLERHAALFWQARQGGGLDGRQFVGRGHRLYSVGETLRCCDRELRERGAGVVFAWEAAAIDLLNITVQQREWEA